MRRFFFRRSATLAVPVIALSSILWGLLFALSPESRRGALAFHNTTILALGPVQWGIVMIISGLLVLRYISPWAVGILAATLSAYTCTLIINAYRFSDAPFTAPIWPGTVTLVLVLAASRLGVRNVDVVGIGKDDQ